MSGKVNFGRLDLAPAADNVLNITASSQQYTLPLPGGTYFIKASGNSVMVKSGASPIAAYPVTDEDGMLVMEGETFGPVILDGPLVAYIGPSAAGWVQFLRVKRPTE